MHDLNDGLDDEEERRAALQTVEETFSRFPYLDMTGQINKRTSIVKANGGQCDVYRSRISTSNHLVAIKQVRSCRPLKASLLRVRYWLSVSEEVLSDDPGHLEYRVGNTHLGFS